MRKTTVFRAIFVFTAIILLLAVGVFAETLRFGGGADDGTGRYIITSQYNDTIYVMGAQTGSVRAAVPATQMLTDYMFEIDSGDIAVFNVEYGDNVRISFGYSTTTFRALYLSDDNGYLTFTSGGELTSVSQRSSAAYWTNGWYETTGPRSYAWRSDVVNYVTGNGDDVRIVLDVSTDTPFFTTATSTDDTHLSCEFKNPTCRHTNMIYHAGVAPTCNTEGMQEYYECPDCGNKFDDENGVWFKGDDLSVPAIVALDENGDGVCDLCGRPMPVYMPVTSNGQILPENDYLLVTEYGGTTYSVIAPTETYFKEQDLLGNYEVSSLPSVPIDVQSDGSVQFMTAKNAGAMQFKLRFIADMTNWSDGGIRYGMHFASDGYMFGLTGYNGIFFIEMVRYSKYGFRVSINSNNEATVLSAYDEWWSEEVQTDATAIKFRAFLDRDTNEVFFALKPADAFTASGANLVQLPVKMMRLHATLNNLVISDDGGSADYTGVAGDVPEISDYAVGAANVTGMACAVSEDAVGNYIGAAGGQGEISELSVGAEITADSFTPADGENGEAVFSIKPYIKSTTSQGENIAYLEGTDFNGSPMTVTLYTCGIYPQQIVHVMHNGTREYFYNEYSEEAQNGAKTFSFNLDAQGNGYAAFTVTEFSQIIVREAARAENFALAKISNGVAVTAPAAGTYTLVFAHFENGRLSSAKVVTDTFPAGETEFEAPQDVSLAADDKVFLLDGDGNTVKPLCAALVITG